MSAHIPDAFQDLVTTTTFPTLVTVMPDGQPQGSIVWFSYDGRHILVNTARGRQKDKNMRARPQVTLVFVDPQNPYRFLEVRGQVAEITEEGALEHINQLSERYTGKKDFYQDMPERRGQEVRVIFKIEPLRVVPH
ncbi:MAG: PPOX class F420-dependent oxidoreductase [Anaerolineae bacterium]|nr:PPOX class F420-dependent oxidoreductase [Anaerolineae bacterium]